MNFLEKNKFIVKHTNVDYLKHDIELLKSKQPGSSLIVRAVKAISFNKKRIAEETLLTLLDHFSPEEILENRTQDLSTKGSEVKQTIPEEYGIEKMKKAGNSLLSKIGIQQSKKKGKKKKNFRK